MMNEEKCLYESFSVVWLLCAWIAEEEDSIQIAFRLLMNLSICISFHNSSRHFETTMHLQNEDTLDMQAYSNTKGLLYIRFEAEYALCYSLS